MSEPKKLIEVAMPIKEISAESVRDKSIRHGHISTLHIWWARRPLPVCRAVIFASIVPDPLDENCPKAFKEAVEYLLGKKNNTGDPYKPYEDIPYTSAIDKMEDNLRNRILMFIGKFSDDFIINEKNGKSTISKEQISKYSLVKWENRNNKKIITKARQLIYVANNCNSGKHFIELLNDFNESYKLITDCEADLYSTLNRHRQSNGVLLKQKSLFDAITNFQEKMPKIFDPFAGGGAIPLEAARLGCKSFGNDINPVAHIIQQGSLYFPQKYGKPITFSAEAFIQLYGERSFNSLPQENKIVQNGAVVGVEIKNQLSFDIEFYAKLVLEIAENKIGDLYPKDAKGNRPFIYFWARVGICSNPSCKAEVPLLKQFYLANKKDKKIYLHPIIKGNSISFDIREGVHNYEEWIKRGNLTCPCCGSVTINSELKKQFVEGKTKEKLIALVYGGEKTKEYRIPDSKECEVVDSIGYIEKPKEKLPVDYTKAMAFCLWGFDKWGDIFSKRQLLSLETIVSIINELKNDLKIEEEYKRAIFTYLTIWFDRIASFSTSFGVWATTIEAVVTPFSRQAIQMVFDFPEANIFSNAGGGALGQLDWVVRYIESESSCEFTTILKNASSGEKEQFKKKSISCVITDPPYYDAIAYADLSDFFYLWMKKCLSDLYPLNFTTPQTPKSDECTALKHHHNNSELEAKKHFENKLLEIFDAIELQTSDIVSIMFAHQSTEAWTTLCNSILGSRMNIVGSWAIDTERSNSGVKVDKAFLTSSVTVSAKPISRIGIGDYKEVITAINDTISKEVNILYQLGFRGADLLTACFGKTVSVFGQYEKVEKADGSNVTVSELLELTRESAFNSLLKGFSGDDYTKFYIGWLQLNGFIESDFDDAAKFTKIGLSINIQDLFKEHILIKNNNKQHLGSLRERIIENSRLGEGRNNSIIDQTHKLMHLYSSPNRNVLLKHIESNSIGAENPVWRVLTSLAELLPKDIEDHKLAIGLIANKDQLIREAKSSIITKPEQSKLAL